MLETGERLTGKVFDISVDVLNRDQLVERICAMVSKGASAYLCALNVHSLIVSRDDPDHKLALDNADIVIPDGFPIAKYLQNDGYPGQERIPGPGLMGWLCQAAVENGSRVFFLGSTAAVLRKMSLNLTEEYPGIDIVGSISPPFHELDDLMLESLAMQISNTGAQIVFVGMGCPKQEKLMYRLKGKVPAVMLGVGAAFDFYAGTAMRAPKWMQHIGLEWLYRLLSEPRRLFWRYLSTNTRYLWLLMREKRGKKHS